MLIWSTVAYRQKDFSNIVHEKLYPFLLFSTSLTWVTEFGGLYAVGCKCDAGLCGTPDSYRKIFFFFCLHGVEQLKASIRGPQLRTQSAKSWNVWIPGEGSFQSCISVPLHPDLPETNGPVPQWSIPLGAGSFRWLGRRCLLSRVWTYQILSSFCPQFGASAQFWDS